MTDNQNQISEEELERIQKHASEHAASIVRQEQQMFEESIHDFYQGSSDERVISHLKNLEKSGKTLYTSVQDEKFFQEVMQEMFSENNTEIS